MELKPIDIAAARRETPGCENVIHFNNAGASLMPRPVLEAVTDHLRLESEIGGYEAADMRREALSDTYSSLAQLLGCGCEEVAVVENATRAWDMAFYAIPFRAGDRILTCRAEYASNYIAFLQVARRTGAEIHVIPSDLQGRISIPALERMIDERVRLIAVTHVPTNGGLVNPVEEIGRVARSSRILFLVDSCQSVGQMPVDVRDIQCDFLSATGRKFLRGPRGTGFLFVKKERIEEFEPPFLDLHAARWMDSENYKIRGDARRFENWEANVAGKIGLGVAAGYALKWGLESIRATVFFLADRLRESLAEIPGLQVHDLGLQPCGIVSFTVKGRECGEIRSLLRERGINVGISPREYTLMDMEERGLQEVIRASLHYYNTDTESDRFCRELRKIVGG